jgi:hypothetical protein
MLCERVKFYVPTLSVLFINYTTLSWNNWAKPQKFRLKLEEGTFRIHDRYLPKLVLNNNNEVHPVTSQEDPKGEWRYGSTLSLTSALDGMGGERHAPAALPPGKDLVSLE